MNRTQYKNFLKHNTTRSTYSINKQIAVMESEASSYGMKILDYHQYRQCKLINTFHIFILTFFILSLLMLISFTFGFAIGISPLT